MKLFKLAFPVAVLAFGCSANAAPIVGSIGFTGSYDTLPTPDTLATATSLTFSGVRVEIDSQFGSYSAVPDGYTPVTFNTVVFNPLTPGGVLWSFNHAGLAYSFTTTSMTLVAQSSSIIALEGAGFANITGFDQTPGFWTITANKNGQTLTFSSGANTNLPRVPDGGTSIALLGASLLGIAGLRRKFRA